MTTPELLHRTAVKAARSTRADIPFGESHPIVLLAAGHDGLLSVILDDPGLAVALVEAVAGIVSLQAITLVVDAYYAQQTRVDPSPNLEERYLKGDPDVVDALQVITVDPGGTLQSTTLRYRPSLDGIIWDSPIVPDPNTTSRYGGRLADGLRLAMMIEPKVPTGADGRPVSEEIRLRLVALGLQKVGLHADLVGLPIAGEPSPEAGGDPSSAP